MNPPHTNYFATAAAAKHYRQGRPDFHAAAMARVKAFIGLEGRLERALDVACGTGLSTKALLDVALRVDGTDSAAEMLRMAHQHPRISYSLASAERQPFPDRSFDLITVCSGVHWFPIDDFLKECRRLLKQKGWLVLYDNFFLGEIDGVSDFKRWYETVYLEKFPAPGRNDSYDWSRENLDRHGLVPVQDDHFANEVNFDKRALIQYFITQSNIIRAVDAGDASYTAISAWLSSELEAFFPPASMRAIRFGNWIKYIRPAP